MKLRASIAWNITFGDLESIIIRGDSVTVTTDYGITITATVHNIQHDCLKLHIGNCSFAAIQFRDIRKLESADVMIEVCKENNDGMQDE